MGIFENLGFSDVRNEIAEFPHQPEPDSSISHLKHELMRSPACKALRSAQNLTYFPVALPFCLAQRFRCASAIFFRAAALSLRRLRTDTAVLFWAAATEVESRARTFLRRAISSSMAARILSVVMEQVHSGA
jgi:hypothetical protein